MIVTCPSCATRYLVDPRALGTGGRMVRCAHCANTWHQTPPDDFPRPLELAVEPATETAPRLAGGRAQLPALPKRRTSWTATLGWVAVVLALIVVATAAVVERQEVIRLWPPASRLYAMAGLQQAPPGYGLELRKVTPSRAVENGTPTLVIDGEVANVSGSAREVPPLKVMLRDREGHDVQGWNFTLPDPRLQPGASESFHTSVPQPNPAATGVVVTFGSEGG